MTNPPQSSDKAIRTLIANHEVLYQPKELHRKQQKREVIDAAKAALSAPLPEVDTIPVPREVLEGVAELLEPHREVEMEVVGCAMDCCGNVYDSGECRSYCVVQGEPEYEPRLVDGPVNQALTTIRNILGKE